MEDTRQVRKTTVRNGDTVQTVQQESTVPDQTEHAQFIVVKIIWYVTGFLEVLLGLRFLFALLGANVSNSFAHLIYSASYPFVKPFFGLFSYNYRYGVSRFETYTLVAMLIYALIAFGIVKLLTINRDDN